MFAELLDRLGGAVGVDRTANRVVLKFDRIVQHAETITDHVMLSLAATPAGTYKLTMEIKDLISGQTTSRATTLIISE